MITVTGASGQLGRLAIAALIKKRPNEKIVAAVRDPEKAKALLPPSVELRVADYNRPETLSQAFAGTDQLLFISSSELGKRDVQHAAVIEAAKRSGVKRLVYTSLLHTDVSGLKLAADHRATEQLVRTAGIPYVILRNGFYFENQTENLGAALAHGVLLASAGDGKISGASRLDFAEAAVNALLGTERDRVYELAGDEAYSLSQLAAEVSRQTGKSITYQSVEPGQLTQVLLGAGLPAALASMLVDNDLGVARGELEDRSGELRALLGRPTSKLADAVSAGLRTSAAAE